MALNNTRWGNAVEAAVRAVNVQAGSPITQNQLQIVWQAICGEHKTEVNTNADIDLSLADIPVLPGTFQDGQNQPITGEGLNNAVVLTEKIK